MDLRIYLKICEGCGCLWYRAQAVTTVYCSACSERFKQFPTPQNRKRRGRPRKIILPTVFAVQASLEAIRQERSAGIQERSTGTYKPAARLQSNSAGISGTGISFAALAASGRAAFNGPAPHGPALNGGAQ